MTFIAFIAAIALSVWGVVYALRGSLLAGAVTYVVVACCFNEYFFHFDVGPVTLTLDRLLLAALVAVYGVRRCLAWIDPALSVPDVAAHRGLRYEPRAKSIERRARLHQHFALSSPLSALSLCKSDVVLFGLIGFLILSLLTGDELGGEKGEVPPSWRLLAGYLMPAIIYWIARRSSLTERRVTGVLAALAGFGLYLSLTGLLETAEAWSLVFPRHIADPKLGLHFGRARGPMLQSVSYGTFVCVCLLSAWIWRARLGRTGQLAVVVALPLFAAAVFFSYARSVWLGAGLAVFVVLGLTLHRSWRRLVLGGMLAAAVLLVVLKGDSFVSFRRESSAADTADSAYLRVSFAYVSWQMFLDRPLMGSGFGRFAHSKLPYLSDRRAGLPLEKLRPLVHHNHYLSLLTETGIIGLGLFLTLLAVWIRNAWQMLRHPQTPQWIRGVCVLFLGALSAYALQWSGHELSYDPIDHSLLFLLAGITVGLRPQAFGGDSDAVTARTVSTREEDVRGHAPVMPA